MIPLSGKRFTSFYGSTLARAGVGFLTLSLTTHLEFALLKPILIGQSIGTVVSTLVNRGANIDAPAQFIRIDSPNGQQSSLAILIRVQIRNMIYMAFIGIPLGLLLYPDSFHFKIFFVAGFLNNLVVGLNLAWWFTVVRDNKLNLYLEVGFRVICFTLLSLFGEILRLPLLILAGGGLPYLFTAIYLYKRATRLSTFEVHTLHFNNGLKVAILTAVFSSTTPLWVSIFESSSVTQIGVADRLAKMMLLASYPISQLFQSRVLHYSRDLNIVEGIKYLKWSLLLSVLTAILFLTGAGLVSADFLDTKIPIQIVVCYGFIVMTTSLSRTTGIEILSSFGKSNILLRSIVTGWIVQILGFIIFQSTGNLQVPLGILISEVAVLLFQLIAIRGLLKKSLEN